MFFQISPVVHKKTKPPVKNTKKDEEDIQPEVLSLAPFTPNPKIVFNDVIVGTVQTRTLIVRNSFGNDVHLFLKKIFPPELNITLSWNEIIVKQHEEAILDLTWKPSEEESCRHTFTISDGRKINRDIAVILKSVNPKSSKTGKSKQKKSLCGPVTLPLSRRNLSPPKKFKSQRKSYSNVTVTAAQSRILSGCTSQSRAVSQRDVVSETNHFVEYHASHSVWQDEEKENVHSTFTRSDADNSSNILFETNDERRDTFVLGRDTFVIPPHLENTNFHDSLESPTNKPLRDLTGNQNTPTLESLLNNRSRFEYKLKPGSFNLSSATCGDVSIASLADFVPSLSSTGSKPASANNSLDKPLGFAKLPHLLFSPSDENATKINISSETYVKDCSGDLSGGTYVKDDLQVSGGFETDNISPCSSRIGRIPSPVFRQPKTSPLAAGQHLSAIVEETGIFNESSLRLGTKRKIFTCTSPPSVKRERIGNEPRKQWSKTGGNAVRVSKRTSGLNLAQFSTAASQNHLATITETTTSVAIVKNPFLYANVIDPFLTSSVYRNDEWLEEQERNFTKWLNALLTPPEELTSKNEVDVARVWQYCMKKDVPQAPSKEAVSFSYHTNKKLDKLRQAAQQLFHSKQISDVLQKVCLAVDSGRLSIREDKDVHRNLKLKSDIIALVLGYNPLWLRLGLETIYNEVIPLKSNSDSHGLTDFMLQRFLSDPYLLKKHKTAVSPKYSADLKKFLLKKFLMLVYLLDQAKNAKLISHDPCLFCKNAGEKDSKSVLTHFARETLSAVGDITKYLKCHGYVVTYVQSYIHEFDYAVTNIGGDLRDGVRLTKVMEIIQMRNDLTCKLRVPAISRLQKVHNNQIVFSSLKESGYEIQFEISPKDLVDGHREKTLSFLWQIIYKFEAPLMSKSATTIQKWFRSLPVALKRRKQETIRRRREEAAVKIQRWYLRLKQAAIYEAWSVIALRYLEERHMKAAIVKLQGFFEMVVCRRKFLRLRMLIIQLQAYSRGWLIRHDYALRNTSALKIQRSFRTVICRKQFLRLKWAAVVLQRRYRAIKQAYRDKQSFHRVKTATIIIQRRFKVLLVTKACRARFIKVRTATITIQSFFRMYCVRKEYLKNRAAVVAVQRRFRALLAMRKQMLEYQRLRIAVITVQTRFRARLVAREMRTEFLEVRLSVIIIQRRFRALTVMKVQRREYRELRRSVLLIQRRFRANILMKTQQNQFNVLKNAVVTVQRRFRARQAMKLQKQHFEQIRRAAIIIQRCFRAHIIGKVCRTEYLQLKETTVNIQRRFRAVLLTRKVRGQFLETRQVVIKIQIRFRALQVMKLKRRNFLKLRQSVCVIQKRFRATALMRVQRNNFNMLKQAAVTIQRRFRAQRLMRLQQHQFQEFQKAVVVIQRWFRARRTAKVCRSEFVQLRGAAVIIQRRYRATLISKKVREEFLESRRIVVSIQIRFRALQVMKIQRQRFLELRQSVLVIQKRFRATQLMKEERNRFELLKNAALIIQRRLRATQAMELQKKEYAQYKKAAIIIQRKFRTNRLAKTCRAHYLQLRAAAIVIQRRFRARKLAYIQWFEFSRLRWAAVVIQQRYRAVLIMREQVKKYRKIRYSTLVMQRTYRATTLGRKQREIFINFKKSAVKIQRFYRGYLHAKRQREVFLLVRSRVVGLQPLLRGYLVRKKYAALLTPEAVQERRIFKVQTAAAVKIQARWRGYSVRTSQQPELVSLRSKVEKLRGKVPKGELSKNQSRTLAERCNAAMLCLMNKSSLKQVNNVLEDLDFATRHCKKICICLSEFLPDQLYNLIVDSGRSEPESEMVSKSSFILINFYKCPDTRSKSWDATRINSLINIMLHWCDKENNLFCSLCTLVWLFAHELKWKRVILKVPNLQQVLLKMYTLIQRKHKMVMKSRQVSVTSPFWQVKEGKLPSCNATWGLDYDGPNAFVNAVHGINNLIKILDFNKSDFL